jgi:hypothetical protein
MFFSTLPHLKREETHYGYERHAKTGKDIAFEAMGAKSDKAKYRRHPPKHHNRISPITYSPHFSVGCSFKNI